MRDGGDVEDGIRLAPWNNSASSFPPGFTRYSTGRGHRVIAGVVAERAFVARLGRVNVAFDDEVGLPCRSLGRRQALGKMFSTLGQLGEPISSSGKFAQVDLPF